VINLYVDDEANVSLLLLNLSKNSVSLDA